MTDPQAPRAHEQHELTYNDYLKVPELLSLQHPQSDPAHHDEMLFIIIHQAYELWFKLILHEVDQAMVAMREDQVLRARHFVNRSVKILELLVGQIHILETMRPVDFLGFRHLLNPASGFQSLQFRTLEFTLGIKDAAYLHFFRNRPDQQAILQAALDGPDVRDAFYGMLRRRGFDVPDDVSIAALTADDAAREALGKALTPIYADPEADHPLYLLTESLCDVDLQVALWREHHVRVVARVIGSRTGTGGSSGVQYLQKTTDKKAFPELWDIRTHLTR